MQTPRIHRRCGRGCCSFREVVQLVRHNFPQPECADRCDKVTCVSQAAHGLTGAALVIYLASLPLRFPSLTCYRQHDEP